MMGGSTMQISTDEWNGQKVGSVVRMGGRIFGATLSLEEVVTEREPPRLKVWRTIGVPRLLVIGNYQMRVAIERARTPRFFGSRSTTICHPQTDGSGISSAGRTPNGAYAR